MKKYDITRHIDVVKDLPVGIAGGLPEGITDENRIKEFFMGEALKLAERAAAEGDVPVGCVIVRHGEIIAAAFNRREAAKNALAHAETAAVEKACAALGGWRLVDCELYVTLEPCPMCAGAIINARVPRVFIGADNEKGGAAGGVCDLFSMPFNHKPVVERGILAEESEKLLADFFRKKRSSI